MDVQQKLDEIVAAVDGARSMPMSASCVVNRAELLALLGEVREALPGSLAQAREVLGDREHVVAEARQEAQRIIDTAQAERGSLVSGTEVARQAQEEADRILNEARGEAAEIRAEADDYVDSKLANFEVVLSKTIGSVDRGREKLLGSGPGAEEWNQEFAEDAPERTGDPHELRQRADQYVEARLGSVSAVLAKTLEAVGRGRLKLRGHEPSDELAAHMAAQDGAGSFAGHTSDADFLAGLAHTEQPPPAPAAPQPPPAPPEAPAPQQPAQVPAQPTYMPPQQPQAEPVAASADPYYAQQQGYVQQHDPYAYGQQQPDPYGQQPDPYAYAQQQADPYGYGQQHQQAEYYQQPQQPQPQQPQVQPLHHAQPQQYQQQAQQYQQQGQLDETSLFDTSMIDLDQVREFERRHDQGGR
ncbi:cell division initiation protein [Streptomyces iconiensis]|uniref:Cell division initiation protein n=1 Tax=Streptomyces iconiensis TaxID=1384038 RepID=A0ABT6ZTZ9_9ACTN|nr:cell division initiation protein [Streptomyces iconiensis]MDJ1132532.1 cell division initiation protein [Streptomyces iconiensis]